MGIRTLADREDRANHAFRPALRVTCGDLNARLHMNNLALPRFVESAFPSLNMGVFGDDVAEWPHGACNSLQRSASIVSSGTCIPAMRAPFVSRPLVGHLWGSAVSVQRLHCGGANDAG